MIAEQVQQQVCDAFDSHKRKDCVSNDEASSGSDESAHDEDADVESVTQDMNVMTTKDPDEDEDSVDKELFGEGTPSDMELEEEIAKNAKEAAKMNCKKALKSSKKTDKKADKASGKKAEKTADKADKKADFSDSEFEFEEQDAAGECCNECNALSELRRTSSQPRKKRKLSHRPMMPMTLGAANTKLGKPKWACLRMLFDSGSTGSIVLQEFVSKLRLKNDTTTKWKTKGGIFATAKKTKIQFALPKFDNQKAIEWDMHADSDHQIERDQA